jgi:hypothetical protein
MTTPSNLEERLLSTGRTLKIAEVKEAQSGITVMISVPDATAPWKCLSGKNGKVDGVEFTGTKGGQ